VNIEDYFNSETYRNRDERMFYYRQAGMSLAAIGAKWGITGSGVSGILAKRKWRAKEWPYQNQVRWLRKILATEEPEGHASRLSDLLQNTLDTPSS